MDTAIAQIYATHVLAGLFALALATGIGIFVSHRLTMPIDRLRSFSEQVALGNLDAELRVGTNNELGDLADTMSNMVEEIKQSRERLELTLLAEAKGRENEILIREIHHRVKNNLQIIGSLFRMNMRRVQSDEAKQVIIEGEARLRSMSLLHEAMHRTDDVSQIELANYLRSVADSRIQSFRQRSREPVVLEMGGRECPVGIDTALPCGLIVNELVNHCLETGVGGQTIGLEIERLPGGNLELTIMQRDAVGDYTAVETFKSSLSYSLVTMMSDQLEGELSTTWGDDGFVGSLSFSEHLYTERVGEMVPEVHAGGCVA